MKNNNLLLIVLSISFLFSCNSKETRSETIDSELRTRYSKLLQYDVDSSSFPRSYNIKEGRLKKSTL